MKFLFMKEFMWAATVGGPGRQVANCGWSLILVSPGGSNNKQGTRIANIQPIGIELPSLGILMTARTRLEENQKLVGIF